MTPKLDGIDHLHVYVSDLEQAEAWYRGVLGFRRMQAQASMDVGSGPLMLESPLRDVHLALFRSSQREPSSVIAFGAGGDAFLDWKQYLEDRGFELRVADHVYSWSMYFADPDENLYEITTNDHEHVSRRLGEAEA